MKDEKQILKWFNGELSNQEIEDLKKSEDFETLEKIAHYATHLQKPTIDAAQALTEFKARKKEKKAVKVKHLNLTMFYKIAAALLVLITTAYFIFYNSTTSFETKTGQTQICFLPDQSEVVLNAASKITFNESKWDNNRILYLEGEAYFQVKKGSKFSVNTKDGVVHVLGTHFNVNQRENYFEVRCYEGLVSVTHKNKTVKLPPGKTFRFSNNHIETMADFHAESPSWMQNESNFEQVSLRQVIAEMERQYDIKINIKDIDTSKLFTGSFTHKNLKTALESVTIPLQISYKINGKTILFYNYEVK